MQVLESARDAGRVKFCPGCKRDLPLEAFTPSSSHKNGMPCRDCANARMKECRASKRASRELPTCGECGAVFTPRVNFNERYCGEECKRKTENRRGLVNHPPRQCRICGNLFYPQSARNDGVCSKNCGTRVQRLKRYSLTPEEFAALIAEQRGLCACCGDGLDMQSLFLAGRYGEVSIDHDHDCCDRNGSCGKCVRGILCGNCNRGLGLFQDDVTRLQRAIGYLETRKGGNVSGVPQDQRTV